MSGWMKCWVVFSLSLLLDVSLPARWQCKAADLLKITFLAWCLAPLHLNGSDLLFDSVVVPVHWVITRAVELSGPPCHTLVVKVSQYILQPSLAALQTLGVMLSQYILQPSLAALQNLGVMLSQYILQPSLAALQTLGVMLSQYILQPSLAALQQLAALLATNIYLIVSATPGEQNINILNTDSPLHMFQVISARPWRVCFILQTNVQAWLFTATTPWQSSVR